MCLEIGPIYLEASIPSQVSQPLEPTDGHIAKLFAYSCKEIIYATTDCRCMHGSLFVLGRDTMSGCQVTITSGGRAVQPRQGRMQSIAWISRNTERSGLLGA